MKKLVFSILVFTFLSAINLIAQQPAKKVEEKTYFAYLLATSDLDVKVTVLNNQNSQIVKSTDELVKIGLDAGDNIIKVTPLDGAKDGYTIVKTADKPGNIAFRADIAARRAEEQIAAKMEEQSRQKMLEKERQGAFDYSFENLEKRTIWGEAPDKSIEYALLPKGSPDNKVYATLEIRYGNEESLERIKYYDQLISELLSDAFVKEIVYGTLKETAPSIYVGFSYQSLVVNIECDRAKIEKVLKVVSEKLKYISFSEVDFIDKKKSLLDSYLRKNEPPTDTRSPIHDAISKPYPKGHPEYRVPNEEHINAINELTYDGLISAQKELMGMTYASISVVGDFDLNSVKESIVREFSGWESLQSYKKIPQNESYCIEVENDMTIFIPNTNKVGKALFIPTGIRYGDADYVILEAAVDILLERTIDVMRKYGLADCKFESFIFFLWDCYIATGFFDCENKACADKLCNVCKGMLSTFEELPITTEELEKYKEKRSKRSLPKDDESVLFHLEDTFDEGKSFNKYATEFPKILGITINQINTIAKKYIKPHKIITIQAGNIK